MRFALPTFIIVASHLSAAAALGQDSTAAPQDTSRAAKPVADTVRAIPQLAPMLRGPASGFSDGVWLWNQDQFQTEAAVTVGDLLERLPTVLTLRSGLYLQAEAASAFGGTANRVEVWLDGYVLDPLLESSFDLSKLELAQVESVRVERRLGVIRIHIETLMPRDSRAYSRIEAGVGQPDANLFRGVLLAPKVIFGPLGIAIDRFDAEGLGGVEPADQSAGWVKSSFIRNGSGLQVEFRRTNTDRDPESPWRAKYERDDLIVRLRARITAGVVAELFGGRSRLEVDTTATEVDSIPKVNDETTQFGGRVSVDSKYFWARGSYRMRDALALPKSQIDGAAGVRAGFVAAAVEAASADWRDAGTANEFTLRAEAAPLKQLRVFGETTTADRGVPYPTGVPDSAAVLTSSKGYRAGGEATLLGITVGAAFLHIESDSVTSFGLPFDRTPTRYFGADATGWELSGRAPLPFVKGLYATGNVTNWTSGNVAIYMPTRMFRTGAEWHITPLKSGNLEVLARIEMIHRGIMLAPNIAPASVGDGEVEGPGPEPTVTLPAVDSWDGYLQIRIMDFRAFLRYEDMRAVDVVDIPNRALRGPRIFYGVKWQFWN